MLQLYSSTNITAFVISFLVKEQPYEIMIFSLKSPSCVEPVGITRDLMSACYVPSIIRAVTKPVDSIFEVTLTDQHVNAYVNLLQCIMS